MHHDEGIDRLEALEAIAAEQDLVLAFRMCEDSDELEPVFMRVFQATGDSDPQTTLLAIADERGLPLGRYVVSRRRLDDALARAGEATSEDVAPAVVPLEWDAV